MSMMTKSKKLISLIMAVLMLVSALPLGVISVFAADTTTEAPQKEDRGFVPYSEFATRMSDKATAAIYKDGVLVYEDYTKIGAADTQITIIQKAITEYASSTVKRGKMLPDAEIAALPEVRVVLNKDVIGHVMYLDRIEGVKLTIDLNGHLLYPSVPNANGEVMRVSHCAALTIVDSNPSAKKNMAKEYRKFTPHYSNVKVLWGGMIVGNYKNIGTAGGKVVIDNATVTMHGGSFAGFECDDHVIELKNGSTLQMYHDAHIYFNRGQKSIVKLRGNSVLTGDASSTIDTNVSYGQNGTVYCYDKGVTVSGVTIAFNYSKEVGGVYAHEDCTLKDLTVNSNSGGFTGGIQLKKGGTVENCTVTKNTSAEQGGGGIGVLSGTLNLVGGTITGNRSQKHGAGVMVNPEAKVNVSGLLIIKDNKITMELNPDLCNSNLYLRGNNDLIPGALKIGSEIWIRTGKSAPEYSGKDHTITEGGYAHRTGISPAFFWADNLEYYVDLISDTSHKNYRSLCLMKGERPVYKDVQTLTSWTPVEIGSYTTAANGSYPLIKGYFEYNLMSTSEYHSVSPFYYSDGYFAEDPSKYNEHLATMSINMAVAAFGRGTDYVQNNQYANHFANVKQLMSDFGCADTDFYVNAGYQQKPQFYGDNNQLSTIGVAISQKKITINGETYTLLPVAIRGGSYEVEWASNVTIGKTGEATGFADAAKQVYSEIQGYLKNYGLETAAEQGKVKFWVVGYSRAGATANLTSKRLVDNYAAKGNQVFGYTFEAPMGGVPSAIVKAPHTGDGTYPTIHNTVNENDFVTLVAPTEMGFIRYGVDHLVGSEHNNKVPVSYDTNSAYWKRRQAMVAQLAAINPYYVFDDYWTAADINVYMGLGGKWNLTEPENTDNKDYTTMYKGLRSFFLRVQKYGLQTSDKSKFREKYSTSTPIKGNYIPTMTIGKHYRSKDVTSKDYYFGKSDYSVQKGVQVLMKMMYTHPNIDQILETIMNNFNTRLDKKGTISKAWWLQKYLQDWGMAWVRDYRPYALNELCHMLLDPLNDEDTTVWSYMSPTEQKEFANALPIVLYFLLEYINEDYQGKLSTTLCTGSFVHNMDAIISNHYQEISVAWVRSNDDYYANDLQAYKMDQSIVTAEKPTSVYSTASDSLTLKAQPGSSIFYSTDGGKSWKLYSKPVSFVGTPETIKVFSIYRGVRSEIDDVDTNQWAGTILGNGNIWFVIGGAAIITAGAVITLEMSRKKKKATEKK